uniref:Uncharacterized protein n=1 Tax=Pyramimonas orientalis virus TaxID=455367 RepID=A0A7M3UNV5_POV01|nr:hypothetical protein HWQ62_00257 [Pyramimonas orientalis virus]
MLIGGMYPPYVLPVEQNEATSAFDVDMNKDLMDRIEKTKKKLLDKTTKIQEIANSSYIDIIYYLFTVGIMCFFLYVILSDIYKTIQYYNYQNADSQRISYKKNDKTNVDNNDYTTEDDAIFTNSNEFIKSSLNKHNNTLDATFKDLVGFKTRNNLNPDVHTSITTNNISSKYDNYNYEQSKNKTSFWELLFKKPKYPTITNNSSGSFFELI